MVAWPFRLSLVLALPLALFAPGCSSSVDDSSGSPGDAGNATSDGGAVGDAGRDVVGPQPDVSAAGDAIGDDSATEDASAAQDGPRADASESSVDAAISADATPDADAMSPPDAMPPPPSDASDAESDAGTACAWSGAPGQCITVAACAALSDHTSYSGECPGPGTIECCIKTPSTADNPPIPAGYHLMQQSQVTPEMTAWAVSILNDSATYLMFATATKTFGALVVLARVEWGPPDFQNGAVHRGVTLYVQ